jgi:signal transduction histidine kinase/ligand-binding sensor domain-containing protein/CheY-like chemotaxis protein
VIRRRGWGKAVVTALALAINAAAQEYSFRLYGSAEGLRSLVVLSLAQDRQGFIWAGTEGGLYRYDGTRFRLMGQEEGLRCSTEVHTLFVASDGALWANTCNAIFRFDGKRFLPVPGVDRLLRGAQVMADGADGRMLMTTPAGLYEAFRNPDGSFSTRPYPLPAAFAGKPTYGILRHGSSVWFGCGRQLCMEEAGRISVFGREQELPEDAWDGIQISKDETVWARSPKAVYRRGPGQTRFSQEKPDLASSGFWGALALGRDGSILIPTDQGLAIHTEAGWAVVNQQRGLRKENTVAVLQDRDGTLWLGSAGGGVARWIGRGVWESWTADQGLPGDVVWNVRRDAKGALWVGTSSGLTRIDSSGRINTWSKKDGLGSNNVRWLAETSDGSIWAATKPGGLARIDPVSGKIRPSGSQDGLPCDPEDVFVDRHDRLWLPTMCGLFVNGTPSISSRVSRVEIPESFGRFAWKVIEDRQGTIWVTNRSALWSWREGQWREHKRREGLLTDNPYVMALAGDGSIWMRHRYDSGVDRLEVSGDRIVRATAIVPGDPKSANETMFHGFDAFGNFWRGTTNGVAVLHGSNWTTFTTEDGLVSNDCDGEAFWADTDGGVWLGTSGGLAHYRPENQVPPSPLIADPVISRLEINQSTRLIRAEFSSLNYKAEQLARFAYRVDKAPWTDLTERTISISGLGPGKHRLEVRGRVRDGPFSSNIAAAEFRLEPRWTETWWTRLLGIMCFVAALTQFVRWRLNAAAQKQAELEAVVAARTTSLSNANNSLEDTARQLRRSENRLKNAERLAHVGHWDWDVKTNQLSWSEELYRLFALPPDHTPTYDSFVQSVVPQDRERMEQRINECLTKNTGDTFDFQITRPNGDVRIIRCTCAVSLDEKGLSKRLFGACQDITDSLRAQQEDFARQKLESLGTLASGIAHDFNNLLGGVLAQADLGLADAVPGSFPTEELTAIRRVAIRGSEIVRQLMIYAGKEADVLGMVDVSKIVLEMLELLKVSVSKHATLISDLESELPAVRANASQIRRIVMNLVTNASEALGDRDGTILVTTSRVISGRDSTVTNDPTEVHYLQLAVSDTGRGLSPEIQARVFDPFFSTNGAGHGLGLAVVQGIVRSLRGSIHITSEPGHGSTFQVLLPFSEAAADVMPEPVFDVGESISASLEIIVLVVEDEEALRQPVATMLRKTGFTVLEAADGAVAIEILRENGAKVDLILLDMTLPGASSHEVLAEAARVRPNVRVILTSAYSLEMLTPPVSASQIHGFIRKPYQLGDLVHALRKAATA